VPTGKDADGTDGDVLAWVLGAARFAPPAELPDLVSGAFARLGATSATLYLSDLDHRTLHPFVTGETPESLAIDGTVAGRAFIQETTTAVPADGGTRLWLPLIDGTARLGVLAVDIADDGPDPADEELLSRIGLLAALAAELVVAKANYTDVIEQVRRSQAMSLAAELQRCTLPPEALVTPAVAVAGILEPAYEVAGDTFDYALNADDLHVAVIDSVGHELRSSLISHLVYGSLRNSRRHGVPLPDAYVQADADVRQAFPDVRFATAAFGTLDVHTGRFTWVSAGHPPPIVVRDRQALLDVDWVPELPIGLGGGRPGVNEIMLERGDVLLLYTDGVVEGGARGSERFGMDRLVDLLVRSLLAHGTLAETLRRLVGAVLEHSAHELHDDACMVLVQYWGGSEA
jgi:serine phosphatase RsbU (regulator of sigma subunit)